MELTDQQRKILDELAPSELAELMAGLLYLEEMGFGKADVAGLASNLSEVIESKRNLAEMSEQVPN